MNVDKNVIRILHPCAVPDSVLQREAVVKERPKIDFRVYPNPATDWIQVSFDERWGAVDLRLIDAEGRDLWTAQSEESGSSHRIPSSIPPGSYYLQVQSIEEPIKKGLQPIVIIR